MRDPRFKILEQLNLLLDPISTGVYSVVPDNKDKPFVYIGDVQLQEIEDKSNFLYQGFATIELFSGSQNWVGSLAPLLTELDNIKSLLRPHKSFVLDLTPNFNMIYWKLSSDTGLLQYSATERVFVATLQFTFKIVDLNTTNNLNDVVHYGIPVEHHAVQVTHQ